MFTDSKFFHPLHLHIRAAFLHRVQIVYESCGYGFTAWPDSETRVMLLILEHSAYLDLIVGGLFWAGVAARPGANVLCIPNVISQFHLMQKLD